MDKILSLYLDSIICLLKGFESIVKDNSLVTELKSQIAKEQEEKYKAFDRIKELQEEIRIIHENSNKLNK